MTEPRATNSSAVAANDTSRGRAIPASVQNRVDAAFSAPDEQQPTSAVKRLIERVSKRISHRHILLLLTKRTPLMDVLGEIPNRMQKVTNQARLVLELIEDFAEGSYRQVPWHALAIAAATLLYCVSPADVVPDTIPALGALDDMVVMAVGMRLVRRHLRAYCLSKGYDPNDYF